MYFYKMLINSIYINLSRACFVKLNNGKNLRQKYATTRDDADNILCTTARGSAYLAERLTILAVHDGGETFGKSMSFRSRGAFSLQFATMSAKLLASSRKWKQPLLE